MHTTLALYKLAVRRAIFCPMLRHQNTDAIACDVTATCNHAHLGTWSIRCDMRLLVHTVMLLVTSHCALSWLLNVTMRGTRIACV